MIYTASLCGLALLLLLLLWTFRNKVIDFLPDIVSSRMARFKYYAPVSTFEGAAAEGFNTGNFNLAGNIEEGADSRAGLDERALREVRIIMDQMRVGFDEARLIRTQREFRQKGVGPDGMPLDKRAITHL